MSRPSIFDGSKSSATPSSLFESLVSGGTRGGDTSAFAGAIADLPQTQTKQPFKSAFQERTSAADHAAVSACTMKKYHDAVGKWDNNPIRAKLKAHVAAVKAAEAPAKIVTEPTPLSTVHTATNATGESPVANAHGIGTIGDIGINHAPDAVFDLDF